MRRLTVLALSLICATSVLAQLEPDGELTVETMPAPGPNWFIAKTSNGGYIFDGESGEMQGLLSLSRSSPTVISYAPREEFYAAESYLARGVHGERTDLVAIYDYDNLTPVAEVIIPNHMARLGVINHLGLTNNGRHLAVLNMNPGHSVSIVDVQDREFVYEVSTPGCAVIMPVNDADFLQVCGDGTLQLIQLDLSGFEENRVRSEPFFDVIDDAVFDRTARSTDGWVLVTHAGVIFEVETDDDEIVIGEGWSLTDEDEKDWRPGGDEFISLHQARGLLYVAMHQGEVDTHHVAGDEVWVFNIDTRRRIFRLELDAAADSLMVTQDNNPKLLISDVEGGTHIFDALTLAHEQEIDMPSVAHFKDM